jgi:hypothetical protein
MSETSVPALSADGKHGETAAYWYELIDEAEAARFLDLNPRTMQGFRYRGGGPRFVRLSSRCVKYRRIDLRDWAEAKLRTSTSDLGSDTDWPEGQKTSL